MSNEVSALLEIAGDTVDRLALAPAQSLHRAIARRVFNAVGPLGAPSRLVHDGISGAVYGALRTLTVAGSGAAARAVRASTGSAEVRPLSSSRAGRNMVSALNAVVGDLLEERRSDLAIEMSLRKAGQDVAATPAGLRRAYPDATGRVALFLHGLAENDEWWRRRPDSYADRLRADLGITSLEVRYNTGLHISDNGHRLDDLLQGLVDSWPVALDGLSLVGHSMGGLVARSAAHSATSGGRRWPRRVRHVVTLGAPHTGAPLAKAVHATAWALRRLPESEPLAGILDLRSAGIRDLRYGYLQETEWRSEDPRRLFDDRRVATPLLGGCTHTFISATVTRDPSHPLGWMAGDLLVRTDSASGRHRTRSIPVPAEAVVHLGPLTHFDLLDHPLVYEQLRATLAGRWRPGQAPM